MKNQYDELISQFEIKLKKLISENKSLKEDNNMLKSELESKHSDLIKDHHDFLVLQKKHEHLRIAKQIASTEEEKLEMKQKIAKLVREIDKCLSLLNE